MKLTDCLHCPACKGRLVQPAITELRCTECDRIIPVEDGVADFVGAEVPAIEDQQHYSGGRNWPETAWSGLFERIQAAAGDRWPQSLGHVLELGCGCGQLTRKLSASNQVRALVAFDTDKALVHACRDQLAAPSVHPGPYVGLATLDGYQDVIRDAVADTVIAITLLPRTKDVRGLLATVHRTLKPGGRALFVVPNRRYRQASCHALATALAQHYAREGAWPGGHDNILAFMAQTRRLLVHQGDTNFLTVLPDKHLFDSEALEDLSKENGFATAEMRPLDVDPFGSETARRICQSAGLEEATARTFASLVATAGQPFFSLLSRHDASASMLLWLTKSIGPRIAVFNTRPPEPPIQFSGPEAALGGAQPRWSLELLAHDSPDGIELFVGGWCLANVDVVWVRITLEDVTLHASVWRPRADVHEVLNRAGLYHSLNALCSGIETQMLFDGVHPEADRCALRFDIVLANGLIVSGPAPDTIIMNKQVVIAR